MADTTSLTSSCSVLLVDDTPSNLVALQAILEPLGYLLVLARSGEDALRCALERPFSAILLDAQMPGLDGFETAKLLRSAERTKMTPILFLTALDDIQRALHGYALGAVDYLTKPIDADVLRGKVRVFVELDAARRAAEADLRAANRFLDAIIENIPDMVFVKDAERLSYRRFNRAGEELLGMSRRELLGKTDRDLFSAAEAEQYQRKDRETLAGKVLVDIPEEQIRTAHGARWLHTKKVSILDEHGRPAYLLGISQDITDRKSTLDALRSAKESAEAANRELEAFSYSVSHDLRAPLRSIDGFSQALLEDCGDRLDDEGKRHLARIRASAQHMATLIDDLLELARVTRKDLRRDAVVDLSALAKTIAERLTKAEPARSIVVKIEDGLTVDGDARLLSIVLENLLGNAVKFTGKRADATIELGVDRTSDPVFYLRDNGAGFDMQYAGKLFGAFQRLHRPEDFVGTGIGLATVQRVIQRHGGRIWAEAAPDRGATFFFTIPSPPR